MLTSFDVMALFNSVPGKEVVQMAIQRAKREPMWSNRMLMTPEEFGDLLQLVVDTTYFRFTNLWHGHRFLPLTSPHKPLSGGI